MEETFIISEKELSAFKEACDSMSGIDFLKYEKGTATVSYLYPSNLFSLGRMFSLNIQMSW